ncbi:hypothetical protein ACFLS7_02015 [Bacteroidota bacterium]
MGDPGRVSEVSDFFNTIEFQISNREFITHTGLYKGHRITALSTGIGTDNIDIVMQELSAHFARQADWHPQLTLPYFIKGSDKLIRMFSEGTIPGIAVTAPGFYGPQGRGLHLSLTDPLMIDKLQRFHCQGHRIANFEMETSALYGLGALMGHETLTICALVANRATGEYNPHHGPVIREMIALVLDRLIAGC